MPWQMGMQEPVTPVMEKIVSFHTLLTCVIFAIGLLVACLLVYVIWRFRAKRHPIPKKFTDHPLLEVLWTAIPVLILVALGVPSLKLLYFMDRSVDADLTIKVTGHQWYWTYVYPDHDLTFESRMMEDQERTQGQPRLLAVDRPLIVPVNTPVRILLTSSDVIHSWAVPAFGIKKDTVPGRLSETWFNATKEGIYYGQCSEICGVNHGFMPIAVEVVSREAFLKWLEAEKKQ